jgi:heme oxygenase (mycobilin-producing)
MIKVLLERRVAKENLTRLIGHLVDLRAAALKQKGYVTGETLVKRNDTFDVMTISTWISEEHWKAWTTTEARIELDDIINGIIIGEPKISIYTMPSEGNR